jgi:hypothetical protein
MNIRIYVSVISIGLACCKAIGHEPLVHSEIMKHAGESAFDLSPAYFRFCESISSECNHAEAIERMAFGARSEDDYYKDDGGFRNYGHFYDPFTHFGLANYPIDHWVDPLGPNSFIWASQRNSPGINFYGLLPSFMHWEGFTPNIGTRNEWSWQNARDHEWDGLTKESSNDRKSPLRKMFRAVGQVAHLLQDTSSPQHVRNEQHLPGAFQSSMEGYGGANIATLNYQHRLLDWKAAGFNKLRDFWDRDLYSGRPH